MALPRAMASIGWDAVTRVNAAPLSDSSRRRRCEQPIQRDSRRDALEPAAEAPLIGVVPQRLRQPEKHVVQHVLGFRTRSEQSLRETEERRPVPDVQLAQRVGVFGARPGNERSVGMAGR